MSKDVRKATHTFKTISIWKFS